MGRRYGTGDGVRGRGGRFRGDFSGRRGSARLEEFAARTAGSSDGFRKAHDPITVHDYGGIGELKVLTRSDHPLIYNSLVKKGLQPSKTLTRAVGCFVINMFLNLPGDDYNRRRYSNNNKNAMRKQFDIFRENLMGLELLFGEGLNSGIGGFRKTINGYFGVDDLVENVDLYSKSKFDIVYLRCPSVEYFEGMEERVLQEALDFYEEELKGHFEYVREHADAEVLAMFGQDDGEKMIQDIGAYLESHDELDETLREHIRIAKYYSKLFLNHEKGLMDRLGVIHAKVDGLKLDKYPDANGLVRIMSRAVAENGVLITEGADQVEIPNFRLVMSYRDVCMYQRINPASR